MASFPYNYTISTDTLYGLVNTDRLTLEVTKSKNISISLDYIATSGDTLTVAFLAPLSTPEETALTQLIAAHTGAALPEPTNANGIPLVALDPNADNLVQPVERKGKELRRATHNFCDPTTWYNTALRTSNQPTVVAATGNLVWQTPATYIVDMEHGKVRDETKLISENLAAGGTGWLPRVIVNGVAKKRLPPHLETDPDPTSQDWSGAAANYDYRVGYTTGQIIFRTDPGAQPTIEYDIPQTSEWFLTPLVGRRIDIIDAEVQWIGAINYNADIVMEVQYEAAPNTWVAVDGTQYRSFNEIVDDARGAYPTQDAMLGTPDFRGTEGNVVRHSPLKYASLLQLPSSQNLRLRVYLGYTWFDETNTKQIQVVTPSNGGLGGYRATAMFYSLSVVE